MKKLIVGCLLMASTFSAFPNTLNHFLFVVRGVEFFLDEDIPKEFTVTTEGVGETQTIAIENALNMAVQKAVGVLIISEKSVSNDQVVKNLISEYSSGVVNSYEVKKCQGKPISCEVTVKVSPWKFMRKLEGDSQTMHMNGNDLLVRHETAKKSLIQRYKLSEYYMSQIRQSGLEVIIRSVSVRPSLGELIDLTIDYEVKWNREFKKELIRFLEKLEKDTVKNDSINQVYIQWGPTGLFENRVRVNTHNENFRQMMQKFMYDPIYVRIDELNKCIDVKHDNVFTVDWYRVRRQVTVQVEAYQLKNLNTLSMGISCSKH